LVRAQGPLSRSDLADRLALSKAAISYAVTPLVEAGLLVEVGKAKVPKGRSPTLLDINADHAVVIGADLGATRLRLCLADFRGDVIRCLNVPTPRGKGMGRAVVRAVLGLRDDAAQARPLVSVVLGTPGVVSGDVISLAPNLPEIESPRFVPYLRQSLPCSVEIHNDVTVAAYGVEAEAGDEQTLVLLSIGTGLGVGVVDRGVVRDGAHGRAGEIGYLPYASPLGNTLETVLSGRGLAELYRHHGGGGGATEALSGRTAAARETRRVFFEALHFTLIMLSLVHDPDAIVITGGVAKGIRPHLSRIVARAAKLAPFIAPVELSVASDRTAEHGAVAMALRRAYADRVDGVRVSRKEVA
jgi:predicted NBD/HSP70 family sugar kinase